MALELPKELWVNEVFRRCHAATLFAVSKVNRQFASFLASHECEVNPLVYFAENGFLNLLSWDQHGPAPSIIIDFVVESAAEKARLDVLRFLHDFKADFGRYALWSAVRSEDIACQVFGVNWWRGN